MSRRKKHPSSKRRRAWSQRPLTDAEQEQAVVAHTAGVVTSFRGIADELHYLCDAAIADLEGDLRYTGLGVEVWTGRSEAAKALVEALTALLRAQQAHRRALVELRSRFAALLATGHQETLDPPEAWEDLVHKRLFPAGSPLTVTPETALPAGDGAPRCVVCGET
jgi:5-carboxymethyl-2-hydroxymuconate isomerase